MRIVKKIIRYFLYFLLIPLGYILIALILSWITIGAEQTNEIKNKTIFLTTNGVHLEIVVPKKNIDSLLIENLIHKADEPYLAFGWGDENFFLNVPNWEDLTLSIALKALFFQGSSLMHVNRYRESGSEWLEIEVTDSQLSDLNQYIYQTFALDPKGEKILLDDAGYTSTDNFYKAKGSYSFYKTCNSWVNSGFKKSGLKSCLWTPFDFGLMNKYE